MDPLHFIVAIFPLALYFCAMGLVQFMGRPWIMSGVWDAALMALAISGWILVGPVELFLPDDAVAQFGVWVGLPVACLYGLIVVLVILLLRPRLIIYSVSNDQLRPLLAQTVVEMDEQSRWAGDCLILPQRGILLHMESTPGGRHVQLVAVGGRQDLDSWRRLSAELAPRIRDVPAKVNYRGSVYLLVGLLLLMTVGIVSVTRNTEIAEAWRELLRR